MCGIAGTWPSDHEAVVSNMLERLAHRGPNASGVHSVAGAGTLGHRRLSIVDLEHG